MVAFLVRALFLGLQTDTFFLCPHMVVREGEGEGVSLSKSPPPLEVGLQYTNLGETQAFTP